MEDASREKAIQTDQEQYNTIVFNPLDHDPFYVVIFFV